MKALLAAQAVDPAASPALGRGPRLPHRAIRAAVPRLDDDRACGVDVEAVSHGILGSDDVRGALRALLGESSPPAGGTS